MPSLQLRVHRVGFAYSDVMLLDEVTFSCGPGWVGVVGANGSGKSTLLQLIAGELTPQTGEIVGDASTSLYRWQQRVDVLTDEVRALAETTDGRTLALLGRLALSADDLSRWSTLSPGERTRWQCAAALHLSPEVLLLDEPTNHLDTVSRGLLMSALSRFRGIGLMVSHDRQLLDALTTATLRLVDARAEWWPMPYSAANLAWQARERQAIEQHGLTQHALRATRQRLVKARSELEATTRNRSAGHRMRDRHDSDARGLGAEARTSRAEQSRSSRQKHVTRRIDALTQSLEQDVLHFERGTEVSIEAAACPTPFVARLHLDELKAGDSPVLLTDVHLEVRRGAHLSIEGPNGAGKSTLLESLAQASTLEPSLVWHLTQDERADDAARLLEALHETPRVPRGRVLQWVDALGADPHRMLRSRSLSPGEARKLRLALGLSTPRALLLLDEPTNHLDLPSIERLQHALHLFEGALVLVTHDAALASGCCTELMRVSSLGAPRLNR